jgi:hypothetical protein
MKGFAVVLLTHAHRWEPEWSDGRAGGADLLEDISFNGQSIVWLAAPFAVLCSGLFIAGYRSLEYGSFIKV